MAFSPERFKPESETPGKIRLPKTSKGRMWEMSSNARVAARPIHKEVPSCSHREGERCARVLVVNSDYNTPVSPYSSDAQKERKVPLGS